MNALDTPSGENVNAEGCADSQNDTDGDSVSDDVDLCPDTPVGETVDTDGCSDSQKDSDNDGVTDDLDECPDTEEGLTVDDKGCAENQIDSDSDGVNDDVTDENVMQWCPYDTIDGVQILDQCANTPEGETVMPMDVLLLKLILMEMV